MKVYKKIKITKCSPGIEEFGRIKSNEMKIMEKDRESWQKWVEEQTGPTSNIFQDMKERRKKKSEYYIHLLITVVAKSNMDSWLQ